MSNTNQIAPAITAPPIVVIDDHTVKLGEWTITVTPTNHPAPDAFDYNIEDENEELVNWYHSFPGNPGKPTDEPLSPVWSEALTVAREEWIEREANRLKTPPAVVLVNADSGLIELAKQTIAQNALARALGDKLCAVVRDNQSDLLDAQANADNGNAFPAAEAIANVIDGFIEALQDHGNAQALGRAIIGHLLKFYA